MADSFASVSNFANAVAFSSTLTSIWLLKGCSVNGGPMTSVCVNHSQMCELSNFPSEISTDLSPVLTTFATQRCAKILLNGAKWSASRCSRFTQGQRTPILVIRPEPILILWRSESLFPYGSGPPFPISSSYCSNWATLFWVTNLSCNPLRPFCWSVHRKGRLSPT